jgi:hypothetical protein
MFRLDGGILGRIERVILPRAILLFDLVKRLYRFRCRQQLSYVDHIIVTAVYARARVWCTIQDATSGVMWLLTQGWREWRWWIQQVEYQSTCPGDHGSDHGRSG